MSGAGVNPLAFFDPQTYAKQLQIQQRQALAQMLLEKGAQAPDQRNPYSGLVSAGNELLGAYLLKRSAKDMGDLYSGGGDNSAPPQQSAPSPQAPPQGLSGGMSGIADQLNAAPPQQPPQQPIPPQQPPQQQMPGQQGLNPRIAQIYNNPTFPKVPGVDPNTAVMALMQGGQGWQEYLKAYYAAVGPTDAIKTFRQAGMSDADISAAIGGKAQKDATIAGRPGGVLHNYMTGQDMGIPGQSGLTPTMMPNGQMGLQMAPNAGAAVAQSAFSSGLGRGATTPAIGYDANGRPIATNQAAMAGQGPAAGAAGLPGFTPQQPFSGYQAPSPIAPRQPTMADMTTPSASLAPELSASQKPFLAHQGDMAGTAFNDTFTEAEGAPDRINVLGNIVNLSRQGALSGPGTAWFGNLAGVASSMGIKSFTPTAEKYQELTKFTYQNAIRAWQVAGGTGTDTQHEAQMHANVNTEMNPGALQSIAQWALAGEHAVMGKANAQQAWLQTHGNTPDAQLSFENNWRNAMDRRVFILNGLPPPEQTAYIQSLSPSDAKQVLQKRQQLRALGAF